MKSPFNNTFVNQFLSVWFFSVSTGSLFVPQGSGSAFQVFIVLVDDVLVASKECLDQTCIIKGSLPLPQTFVCFFHSRFLDGTMSYLYDYAFMNIHILPQLAWTASLLRNLLLCIFLLIIFLFCLRFNQTVGRYWKGQRSCSLSDTIPCVLDILLSNPLYWVILRFLFIYIYGVA